MKSSVIVVIAVMTLTGCAASSVKDMKERAAYGNSFILSENYQAVYRRTKDDFSRCVYGHFTQIDGDLYTDIPKAEIRQTGSGRIFTLFEIEGLDDKSTRVEYWVIDSSWKRILPNFEAFFLEGTPICKE